VEHPGLDRPQPLGHQRSGNEPTCSLGTTRGSAGQKCGVNDRIIRPESRYALGICAARRRSTRV
jgi:hypothetical protein